MAKSRGLGDDDGDGLPSPAAMKAEVKAMKAKQGGETDPKVTTPPPPAAKFITVMPPPEVEAANPNTFAALQNYKHLIQGYTYAKALQKLYKEDPVVRGHAACL